MQEIEVGKGGKPDTLTVQPSSTPSDSTAQLDVAVERTGTRRQRVWWKIKEPGSVWQIIIAALLAIVIGLAVTTQVDEVPEAAVAILAIPGNLWLRALRAVGELDEPLEGINRR